MVKKIVLIVLLCVLSSSLYAQYKLGLSNTWEKYSINNYGVEDGIFSQQVYKIHKDESGFYWIVSNKELLRYDGLSLKKFKKGGIGGTLYDILPDTEGNMWIPSIGAGLYMFNGDSLTNFVAKTGDLTKAVSIIENDSLVIGSYGEGLKIFYEDSVYTTYTSVDGLVGNEIWTLEKDSNGNLWIGTNTGLSIYKHGTFKNFTIDNGLPDNRIRAIKALHNGEVWVGTDKEGIVIFEDQKPVRFINSSNGLPNLLVQDIEEGLDGDVFIGTLGGGITRYNDGIKETLTSNDGLISDEVNTILFDPNGMLLIGTEDGLSVLVPKFFETLSLNGKDLFLDEAVTINQDGEGRIWIGMYGKGYRFYENGNWKSRENPPKITNGYAQSGTLDKDGNLWVGTQGAGVFEIVNNQFIPRYSTKNGLFEDYVRGLTFDLDRNLWIGSNGGISVYNTSGELINTYSEENEIPNAFCITMITASDGSIWYGSYGGGVVRFKNGNKTIYNTEKGLLSNQVLSIYEDSNKEIWIGTFNYGISKVLGDSLFTFSPKNGLPSANAAGIIEDDYKNLWFATGNGITKIALQSLNDFQQGLSTSIPFHFFNKEDGLISDNLQAANNATVEKLDDGTLLFASIDGVSIIKPDATPPINSSSFKPYIDDITVGDKKIESLNAFVLNPDDLKLSISYSAINYFAPKKTDFRIRLSGIDEDWVYVDKRTTAYYDYLPDGNYTFTVSAIGPDGQWSDKTASVSFTVLPPFYKTWWFISLCLLGIFSIGAGGVQLRSNVKLRALNRELELQKKIHNERERISRDLHDNVGSQITNLITGIEISSLYNEKNQKNEVKNMLQDLDADARSAMTDLRETIWLLDKEKVGFNDFIERVKAYINRQKRYLGSMNIEVFSSINTSITLNPTQSLNLMRIIQEALNNSKKYAEATAFKISFSLNNENLAIEISDNGIGMNLDESIGLGNGLENMKKRAEDISANYKIGSQPESGTSILIEMPLYLN